ncbi:integration host factor subunit alpha [Piscirickettsia salmonis]|uniref:Integration host factor subunit alpha n=1 Tax=Piscirickettsia salmonis TaxID=1238 RepID=A0A095CJV2_PISSA|nr:integration host factor subunit alpha [Piscirickettsia salmonis]OAJ33723.1 Integration host factor subunit alpha [Piscirickettsiaceae bacterium NZ-RLO1]RNC78709.1 integration host factor subunit alpha [Piscirickettsiaceae bacterium NZ-RLO2]AKP73006.1 integration host factor subunit alpha [Piscirickettsia salmonis LF-89 = ATCC VR-1361]ALA26069.1 integration host factor, alpha subunit [Piscirickettsia salmonis]ALB21641.1 integration host factor, alpha subunit [Piscirickettsia salmonis]
MALTKAVLMDKLFADLGVNKQDAKMIVDLFFEEIQSALEKGQIVKLSGFGNFMLRDKKERPGRNPKTGDEVAVSARRVVTFRAGQKLRARVNSKL